MYKLHSILKTEFRIGENCLIPLKAVMKNKFERIIFHFAVSQKIY